MDPKFSMDKSSGGIQNNKFKYNPISNTMMRTLSKYLKSFCLTFLLVFSIPILAQSPWLNGVFNKSTEEQLPFDQWMALLPEEYNLFEEKGVLEIGLETDFKQLIRKKKPPTYQEALLHFPLKDSLVLRRIIQVKPRGNNRRERCARPPLKLKFTKTEVYVNGMEQLKKMKMVYECKKSHLYEQYVLKEYLIYKIYNLFTNLSFKTRLLKLNYIDIGRKKPKTETGYAFLIEETDNLALRNNLFNAKVTTASKRDIDDLEMARVAMFQYMIGNADWSITGLHNMKLFTYKENPLAKALAVPYDFDYSGFVNAQYAIPSETFNIATVRERVFLGSCYNKEMYSTVIKEFLAKKSEIYSLIEVFPDITERTRNELIRYLDEFYNQIIRENSVNYFLKNCRK